MIGTIGFLALAAACFVGGHFLLSSRAVRGPVAGRLGEGAFRALYAVFAAATMVWTVMAYNAAPYVELWTMGAGFDRLPVFVMPFACILFVAGVTTRTVTVVGGESMAREPDAVSGIVTITRHPFLWGIALWAAGHIVANGDAASVVLFGAMLVLALGGMAHIDHRRRATLGSDWGPIALTTSVIPFLAAIQGRRRIDWAGIGWARPAAGLAFYAFLAITHGWTIGITVVPEFLVNLFG
jgi:uncharacterized membrane protein